MEEQEVKEEEVKKEKEEEKKKEEKPEEKTEEKKEEEKVEEKEDEKDEKEEDKKVEENKEDKKEDEEKENEEEKQEEEKDNEQEKKGDKKKEKKAKKEKKNLILTIDEENNVCVDCGKEHPTKVSINNGTIICEECATKHEELGHGISFVKNIDDDFDEYLLNYIVFGSNSKFKRFLIQENVDQSLPIEKKYLTKACFYYRNNLRNKVRGEKLEEKKDYEDPNEIVENVEDKYPEFEHYKIKSKVVHDGALKSKQNTKLNKIGGNILSFGKKMYGGIKYGANVVAKKTEGPTKSIKKGAGFLGKQVSNAYASIKKNVMKGQKKKDTKEEDMNKDTPPNINNGNIVAESGRPLNQGAEVKEENVEVKKEGEGEANANEKEAKQQEKQDTDSNEEKIDI
jgi:hypothetical protein